MPAITPERSRWFARNILPHEHVLRGWLNRRLAPGLDADDVIQEAYTILVSKESVEDIQNPKAYLFQVAYSLLVRHVQRSRIVSIRAVADLERLDLAAEMASPEQVLIDRDELHRLAEAIAEMPEKTQEAFILRRVQGLSQREIAARMGVSENTVEKHIVKGIRLLIDRFGRGGKRALGASRNDDTGTNGLEGRARDKSGG
jgi:RNA polymerase sigma-70 factor (ECF subfamily)